MMILTRGIKRPFDVAVQHLHRDLPFVGVALPWTNSVMYSAASRGATSSFRPGNDRIEKPLIP
jgi:hypothetical protein